MLQLPRLTFIPSKSPFYSFNLSQGRYIFFGKPPLLFGETSLQTLLKMSFFLNRNLKKKCYDCIKLNRHSKDSQWELASCKQHLSTFILFLVASKGVTHKWVRESGVYNFNPNLYLAEWTKHLTKLNPKYVFEKIVLT